MGRRTRNMLLVLVFALSAGLAAGAWQDASSSVFLESMALSIVTGRATTASAQSRASTELTIDAAPVWFEEAGSVARIFARRPLGCV